MNSRRTTGAAALILALLAGCGGGSDDDAAVSANPPAGPPAGAPSAQLPDGESTPVDPNPADPAPVDPTPVDPPESLPPLTAANSVAPAVVALSLTPQWWPGNGGLATLCPTNDLPVASAPVVFHAVRHDGIYFLNNGAGHWIGEDRPPYCSGANWSRDGAGFQSLGIEIAHSEENGGIRLSGTLTGEIDDGWNGTLGPARAFTLTAQPLVIEPTQDRIRKDQTFHRWSSPNPDEPWFAELQLHSDPGKPDDPNVFKLCWHVNLPAMQRLICVHHTYEPAYDRLNLTDISVSDDGPDGLRSYSLNSDRRFASAAGPSR